MLPALGFFIGTAKADIYVYTDKNGVRRFTDIKPATRHAVYLKTPAPLQKLRRSNAGQIPASVANRYDKLIQKAADTYQLPFSLIKSVIRVESAFNPSAVSPKGAKGLMQIMPENYKPLAITNPFDPEQSIMGGAQYLKSMLHRYKGIVALALAAYNAGPEAVDRYHKKIPPFTETRKYVNRVLQYYRVYDHTAS